MSEILKKSGDQVRRWYPVVIRALLYFAIAAIPEFLKEVRDFWKQGHWPPPQINALGLFEGGWAGFVAIRAFLDTFLSKHSDALIADDKKKQETTFFKSTPAP